MVTQLKAGAPHWCCLRHVPSVRTRPPLYPAVHLSTEARAAELKAGVERSRAPVSDSSGEPEPNTSHQTLSPVNFVGLPVRRLGEGVDLSAVLEALFEVGVFWQYWSHVAFFFLRRSAVDGYCSGIHLREATA